MHIQNTSGINAPMATNIGNIAGDSSFSYGSRVFGPLGLRLLRIIQILIIGLIYALLTGPDIKKYPKYLNDFRGITCLGLLSSIESSGSESSASSDSS